MTATAKKKTTKKKPPPPVDPAFVQSLKSRKWFVPALRVARYMLAQDANKKYDYIRVQKLIAVTKVEDLDIKDNQWRAIFGLAQELLIFGWRREMHNAWGVGYVLCHIPEQNVIEIIKSQERGYAHLKKGFQRYSRNERQLREASPETALIASKLRMMQELTMPTLDAIMRQLKGFKNDLLRAIDPAKASVAGLVTDPTKQDGLPAEVKRLLLDSAKRARKLKAVPDEPPKQLPAAKATKKKRSRKKKDDRQLELPEK